MEASDHGVPGESGAIGRWEAQEQRDKGCRKEPGAELPALVSRPLGLRLLTQSPLIALHHAS